MNTEEQVAIHIRNLSVKEVNNFAIHMKHPNTKKGNKAPLGVKASQQQRKNFILWLKQTGNIETAGKHLDKLIENR
jgi:hypothetical protein